MRRALLHTGLFLAGMLGTAAWLARASPMPIHEWARAKVAHVVTRSDHYDTLVFGSSRLHYSFDPRVFDARMRELGHPSTSFNLAFSGMRTHDFDELAHWIVERRPPALRRVVLELTDWDPGDVSGNWLSWLQVDSHTPRRLWPRIVSIFQCNDRWGARLEKLQFAVGHTLVNGLSIGHGQSLLSDLWRSRSGEPLQYVWPVADEGFKDVAVDPWPANVEARKQMLARPEEVADAIAGKAKDPDPVWMHGGFNFAAWERLDRVLRDHGIEPVYVVMPALMWWWRGRENLPAVAQRAIVIDFDNPALHPALYEMPKWFDRSHLNRDGATYFSAYLAERLVERLPK